MIDIFFIKKNINIKCFKYNSTYKIVISSRNTSFAINDTDH